MKILLKTKENTDNLSVNSPELIAVLQSRIENLSHENIELKKQNEWLKQQFNLGNQRQFGKSSETSSTMNLSLFDEGMSDDQLTGNEGLTTSETITYTRKKKTVGRQFDVSKFPKEQKIYDLEESEKTCACGNALEKAGEDKSIQVDHIPETFNVIEHIALKYCCRQCETIKSAKKPETAIPKCMATPGFVAEVITKNMSSIYRSIDNQKYLQNLAPTFQIIRLVIG